MTRKGFNERDTGQLRALLESAPGDFPFLLPFYELAVFDPDASTAIHHHDSAAVNGSLPSRAFYKPYSRLVNLHLHFTNE